MSKPTLLSRLARADQSHDFDCLLQGQSKKQKKEVNYPVDRADDALDRQISLLPMIVTLQRCGLKVSGRSIVRDNDYHSLMSCLTQPGGVVNLAFVACHCVVQGLSKAAFVAQACKLA